MELSNYELIRYPSGQPVITRVAMTAGGVPASGPRDVIGAYASEQEAQPAMLPLAGPSLQRTPDASSTAQHG